MALNCIVDDSALLAGLCADAKYSIKQWIDQGAINAFVPLYTLERLNALHESNPSRRDEVQNALEWLDTLTSQTYKKTKGRVQLQGPDDQYPTWREVEQYILPDTPFSSRGTANDLSRAFERELSLGEAQSRAEARAEQQLDGAAQSPDSNGPANQSSEAARTRRRRGKSASPNGVPQQIKPLINFVVWRSHHEDEGVDGAGHYILLTDDASTQRQAQKFGIRAKRMSQVSSIVAREAGKRNGTGAIPAIIADRDGDEDDRIDDDDDDIGLPPDERPAQEEAEDEIVFDPSRRPQSSRSMKVLDPDSFGRQPIKAPVEVPTSPPRAPKTPVKRHTRGRGSGSHPSRGGGAGGGRGERGQGGMTRASKAPPESTQDLATPKSPPREPQSAADGVTETTVPHIAKPIDPDSYARNAAGSKGRGRGRGRGRGGDRGRLWEPT